MYWPVLNASQALDFDLVKNAYKHSNGPVISILLSDGDLYNDEQILRELAGFWKKNPFVFVAIKSNTPFSKILESQGLSVKHVTDPSDLNSLVLDFAKKELEKYKISL
ncbi:MAG: hypothetical protein ACP5T4_00960 [Candidatus Micrarchaeia archaeon]